MTKPKQCPVCKSEPSVDPGYYRYWYVTCDNCYDGAPDAGVQLLGSSHKSKDDAIERWNEQVEDYEA